MLFCFLRICDFFSQDAGDGFCIVGRRKERTRIRDGRFPTGFETKENRRKKKSEWQKMRRKYIKI